MKRTRKEKKIISIVSMLRLALERVMKENRFLKEENLRLSARANLTEHRGMGIEKIK